MTRSYNIYKFIAFSFYEFTRERESKVSGHDMCKSHAQCQGRNDVFNNNNAVGPLTRTLTLITMI